MNIEIRDEDEICHYCHENFNGMEEGFAQAIESGEALYHLRCIGKLMVYRIEGVLPQHLFTACIEQLSEPLPEQLREKTIRIGREITLDDFTGEEE